MISIIFAVCGVILLNVYALVLVYVRSWVYKVPLFRPMVWNIFLSVLPAGALIATGIAMLLTSVADSADLTQAVFALGALVWLLLLPNAAYLITELNLTHRRADDPVPLWFDIVQTLTLALSGVANALLNVALAQVIVMGIMYGSSLSALYHPMPWLLVVATLVLVTAGMYLGRYLRVNSWDVRHPIGFVKKVVAHFRVRRNVLEAFGFCLTHSLLLTVLYIVCVAPVLSAFLAEPTVTFVD